MNPSEAATTQRAVSTALTLVAEPLAPGHSFSGAPLGGEGVVGTAGRVMQVLNRNLELNFVQRILRPTEYPRHEDGGSHGMVYGIVGDHSNPIHIVYPTVVQRVAGGPLELMEPSAAFRHAMDNREFIVFDSESESAWFTDNYRSVQA